MAQIRILVCVATGRFAALTDVLIARGHRVLAGIRGRDSEPAQRLRRRGAQIVRIDLGAAINLAGSASISGSQTARGPTEPNQGGGIMTGALQPPSVIGRRVLRAEVGGQIQRCVCSRPGKVRYLVMRNRLVGGAAWVETDGVSPARMAQLRAGWFADQRLADPCIADPVPLARLLAAGNSAALSACAHPSRPQNRRPR